MPFYDGVLRARLLAEAREAEERPQGAQRAPERATVTKEADARPNVVPEAVLFAELAQDGWIEKG